MKLHIHDKKCTQEIAMKGFNGKKRWFGFCKENMEFFYFRPHGNTDPVKALRELQKICLSNAEKFTSKGDETTDLGWERNEY